LTAALTTVRVLLFLEEGNVEGKEEKELLLLKEFCLILHFKLLLLKEDK